MCWFKTIIVFVVTMLSVASVEAASLSPSLAISSPNGRFRIQFSEPRSKETDLHHGLWAAITIRDLSKGTERIGHIAEGHRGNTRVWQAFAPYEGRDAWSPDNRYLAFWNFACVDESAVPSGAVCHLHEIVFLPMFDDLKNSSELALGRYEFLGWAAGYPHTVLFTDINTGKTARRTPYIKHRSLSK